MIAVVQRVSSSRVKVGGKIIGEIGKGVNVLLGVVKGDREEDVKKLAEKVVNLRIFEDERGKFQFSLKEVGGSALVVSQFTLCASLKKGRRPSFEKAEEPSRAQEMYEKFVQAMRDSGIRVETGQFGAMMEVEIINWGPVTFILDSREL
jgi:D-tyrosyl-tRNA(Tyr) deacylase